MEFENSTLRTHRFFLLETPIISGQAVDLSPLAHQLRTVLRLQPGAVIELLDGEGNAFHVEVTRFDRQRAAGQVHGQRMVETEPSVAVTLYQCSLKADKFEWVLQKGTELGVTTFVPVISERSIVRPAVALRKKYERWRAIIREAAEQSGRGILPRLLDPLEWDAAIVHASGLRLLPWEEDRAGPRLRHALDSARSALEVVSLLIGPEGGITPGEAAAAQGASWQTVSLGQRVLRAETAALTSVALVVDWLE